MDCLRQVMAKHNKPVGSIMQPLRLAITGIGGGPDLMGIIEVLGKQEVSSRIEKAINTIK